MERPAPRPMIRIVRGEGCGIFLGEAHEAQHQDHHRDGKRRVLRVHEHVPVEGRAQRKQQQRRQPGKRAADAPRQPPRHGEADQADHGAEQTAGFEQFERDDLVQQRRGHVEAAAVHIEIGERQRAGVVESGAVHPQQQIGVFGVGVVVPAQSVVTKGQSRDQGDRGQHEDGKVVAGPLHRAPHRRIDEAEVVIDDMAIGNPVSPMAQLGAIEPHSPVPI